MNNNNIDVLILGAGAAGLFCAFNAAKRGLSVVVLEKQDKPGKKILISGGGRCNFINTSVDAKNFHSQNPHFCKSALARYSPVDFIKLVESHGIAHHEKHRGQLFCDHSSKDILNMLLKECSDAGVKIDCDVTVDSVTKQKNAFPILTTRGEYTAKNIVIATGGLSYAKLGATDFGYRVAQQFGNSLIDPRPALTPFLWSAVDLKQWQELAGVACPVKITLGKNCDQDDLLFTHNGLSGPVVLRISTYWREGDKISIDFLPGQNLAILWLAAKEQSVKILPKNLLAQKMPARLANKLCDDYAMTRPLVELSIKNIQAFSDRIHNFDIVPAAIAGYEKAEVTAGGVDTKDISSQNMESKLCPGLYFIGEVVDVTGDLGGFNFAWAWASGFACSQALSAS